MDYSEICLNKLPQHVENSCTELKNYFLIQTKWLKSHIQFFLQEPNTNKLFMGELALEVMRESSTELEVLYEEFYNDCRKALTTHMGLSTFIYELDTQNNKFLLIKKVKFALQYLEIELKEENNVNEMLGTAIDIINRQKELNSEKDEISEKLRQNYQEIVNSFEKSLEEKNNLESKLLKKFTLLLNSKKNKISELQELLMEMGNSCQDVIIADDITEDLTTEPSTSSVVRDKKNVHKKKVLLSSSDDDDFLASTQLMTQPLKI